MPDFAPWQGGKGIILKHKVEDSYYVEVTEVPPANHSIRVGHTAWLWPEWLKLVEEVKEAHPSNGNKFKAGDWVEVTGWSGSHNGQVTQIGVAPAVAGSIHYKLENGLVFSDKYLKAAEAPKGKGKSVDLVNDPSHYGGKDNPYEVIKVAEAWGFEKNAYLFNALKYLGRAGHKGRKVEDLNKLVYYVQREIALEAAK